MSLCVSYIASAFRMAARIRCKLGHPKSALRLLKFVKERLDMTSDPEGQDELVRVLFGTVEAHLQLRDISDARQLVQQAQGILCGSEGFAMQCGSTCPVDKPELQSCSRRLATSHLPPRAYLKLPLATR